MGTVTWHPLQLVFLKKEVRPIPIDFGTYFGLGYGIAGERRGMDGIVYEWTSGWERTAAGARVPIGASGLNPGGWPRDGVRGSTLLVQVTSETPERQCRVELVLP